MKLDRVLEKLLIAFFSKLKIRPAEKRLESLIQFIKFCMVGVTNTAISYVINVAVLLVLAPFHFKWDYVVGNLIAFFLSVLWSFYWNNKYVFKEKEGQSRSLWKTLLKTYLSYAFTGIFLANILSYLWIEVIGVSKYFAPVLNLVISVPVNYLINKKWAFNA